VTAVVTVKGSVTGELSLTTVRRGALLGSLAVFERGSAAAQTSSS